MKLFIIILPLILQLNLSFGQSCQTGNCEDGFGIYSFSNGDVFRGNSVAGKFSGYGEYYHSNGDVSKGNWVTGSKTGQSTYYFSNGDVQVANWANGIQTQIISTTYGNQKPQGCLSGNCQNGFGKKGYVNGIYEGNFSNGQWKGRGKMTYPNGSVYEGEYNGFDREGYGVYIWASGKKYEGNWASGKVEGEGTFYYLDGSRYTGNFSNYVRTGYGVYYYLDGSIYSGNWKEELRHGNGRHEYANGKIEEGTFENGKFLGIPTQKTIPVQYNKKTFDEKVKAFGDDKAGELKYYREVINATKHSDKNEDQMLCIEVFMLKIELEVLFFADEPSITLIQWQENVEYGKKIVSMLSKTSQKNAYAKYLYFLYVCQLKCPTEKGYETIRSIVNDFTIDNWPYGKEFYIEAKRVLAEVDGKVNTTTPNTKESDLKYQKDKLEDFSNSLILMESLISQNKLDELDVLSKKIDPMFNDLMVFIQSDMPSEQRAIFFEKLKLYPKLQGQYKVLLEQQLNKQQNSNITKTQVNSTTKTTVEKSELHVFVCNDCGKMQTAKSEQYDKSTCPETRWGGIGRAGNISDDGDHDYQDLGNSGSQQFVCSGCHITIMLFEKPTHSGACGARGSNCCSHNWNKN